MNKKELHYHCVHCNKHTNHRFGELWRAGAIWYCNVCDRSSWREDIPLEISSRRPLQ